MTEESKRKLVTVGCGVSEFRRHLGEFSRWMPALDETQIGLLEAHYEKLRFWMRKLNLTSIKVPREMVLRHYVESLWLAARVPDGAAVIVDAGAGAGFPGVPAAALHRGARVTLVEADRRKAVFLEESTLGWGNVVVLPTRLETLALRADAVISRGVDVGEVRAFAGRQTKWCGVLTSEAIAAKFNWDAVERLPWDPNHVVAFLNVPRETD